MDLLTPSCSGHKELVRTFAIFFVSLLAVYSVVLIIPSATEALMLEPAKLFSGEFWRLFTYQFVHNGLSHLAENMIVHLARRKHPGYARHVVLVYEDVALFIHLHLALKDARVRIVTDIDKDACHRLGTLLVCLHVSQPEAVDGPIAYDLCHHRIPHECHLLVPKGAVR